MKNYFIAGVLSVLISCTASKHNETTQTNNQKPGKLIVKEFPIDPNDKNASQKALEAEQMRLMKKYPNIHLAGVIAPDRPWVLITEKCETEEILLKLKKQLSKDCPDAKIVDCGQY
ncbi:MAG: hypothetical protein JWP12_482 [Bacteroidetes bacterium]|nr:hypothetical protein [Bacteroidota bacterium]